MLELPKRELLFGAGLAAAGVVAFLLLARYGRSLGEAAGAAAGEAVIGAGVGGIFGIGSAFGLPDTSDEDVVSAGQAALDRGDVLEASTELPALEFLNGIGEKFGSWVYDVVHPSEAQ